LEERGWHKEGGTYHGDYSTRFGTWPGMITVSPSGRVEFFIQDPRWLWKTIRMDLL